MNRPGGQILSAIFATLVVAAGLGCSREGTAPPAVLTAGEVPERIESVFATAPTEARQAAADLSGSLEAQPAGAFFGFQELSYRPDLTPEQRTAVAQAMMAARAKLEAAAAGGDAAAREALEQQAARK